MAAYIITLLLIGLVTFLIQGFSTGTPNVPDGVVYTLPTVLAGEGEKATIPCYFFGTPFAVYWMKGEDLSTATTLIVTSRQSEDSWKKTGPRFVNGWCDIDGNFSLVINRVEKTDEGKYICKVSNYRGVLIHNSTNLEVKETTSQSPDHTSSFYLLPSSTLNTMFRTEMTSTGSSVSLYIGLGVVALILVIGVAGFLYCRHGKFRYAGLHQLSQFRHKKRYTQMHAREKPSWIELQKLANYKKDDTFKNQIYATFTSMPNRNFSEDVTSSKILELLLQWRNSAGSESNRQQLFDMLRENNLKDAANYLKEFITTNEALGETLITTIEEQLEECGEETKTLLLKTLCTNTSDEECVPLKNANTIKEWSDSSKDVNQQIKICEALEAIKYPDMPKLVFTGKFAPEEK